MLQGLLFQRERPTVNHISRLFLFLTYPLHGILLSEVFISEHCAKMRSRTSKSVGKCIQNKLSYFIVQLCSFLFAFYGVISGIIGMNVFYYKLSNWYYEYSFYRIHIVSKTVLSYVSCLNLNTIISGGFVLISFPSRPTMLLLIRHQFIFRLLETCHLLCLLIQHFYNISCCIYRIPGQTTKSTQQHPAPEKETNHQSCTFLACSLLPHT